MSNAGKYTVAIGDMVAFVSDGADLVMGLVEQITTNEISVRPLLPQGTYAREVVTAGIERVRKINVEV